MRGRARGTRKRRGRARINQSSVLPTQPGTLPPPVPSSPLQREQRFSLIRMGVEGRRESSGAIYQRGEKVHVIGRSRNPDDSVRRLSTILSVSAKRYVRAYTSAGLCRGVRRAPGARDGRGGIIASERVPRRPSRAAPRPATDGFQRPSSVLAKFRDDQTQRCAAEIFDSSRQDFRLGRYAARHSYFPYRRNAAKPPRPADSTFTRPRQSRPSSRSCDFPPVRASLEGRTLSQTMTISGLVHHPADTPRVTVDFAKAWTSRRDVRRVGEIGAAVRIVGTFALPEKRHAQRYSFQLIL